MDRLERIAYFENALSELCASLKALEVPLERFYAAQEKAGVLSEDAAYDALCDRHRLLKRMRDLAGRYLRE